jgi:hypothetical protein
MVGCVVIFPAVAGEIIHYFTGRRGDELARRRLQEAWGTASAGRCTWPDLTWMTMHLAAQRRLANSVGGVSDQQVGSRAHLHTALGYGWRRSTSCDIGVAACGKGWQQLWTFAEERRDRTNKLAIGLQNICHHRATAAPLMQQRVNVRIR